MLINVTYFTAGPRHILNATCGTQSTEVNAAIMAYVDALQFPFLCEMLGEEAGAEVEEYLRRVDEDETEANEEMESLCKRLRQSFADYVFYKIIGENNTQGTITGLVQLKCANAYVAPINRQVQTWNRMVARNRLIKSWCSSEDCKVGGIVMSDKMLTKINTLNL
ncbi:MAG: hypothetical protein LUD17_05235 [Bacteroidales bacterium]|nr:hypothetical protein [Bacteroidales bacterium]